MALITSKILTPIGPKAGPSGGPAEASPPVTNDEILCLSPIIFFYRRYDLFLPIMMVSDNLHLQLQEVDMVHLEE